jgi:predicted trehalose synthase
LLVGGALAAAVFAMASPATLVAQGAPSTREDLVAKIAGKKIHKDKVTGQVRAITVDEARDLIASIVAMTTRTEAAAEPMLGPGRAQMVAGDGHAGHVLISRYNPDGTVSVRCIASADEAADFLAEEPLGIQ